MDSSRQIHKNQAKAAYEWAVGKELGKRAPELRPTAKRPATLDALQSLHQGQALAAPSAGAGEAGFPMPDAEPVRQQVIGYALDDEDAGAARKKRPSMFGSFRIHPKPYSTIVIGPRPSTALA